MIFGKKGRKCESCGSDCDDKFSYCPYCGKNLITPEKEMRDYGLLGRTDALPAREEQLPAGPIDQLLNNLINSLVKSLDKQLKKQLDELEFSPESDSSEMNVHTSPHGIRINIAGPHNHARERQKLKLVNKPIDSERIRKLTELPKAKAKTKVKRVGDKLFYEMLTPGVDSLDDVFVSKLESGYEIKAIGKKKVYVNSVPINLPLKRFTILKNKLLIEFNSRAHEPS